ncbi:hypothetical protein [Enterobacter roggenkampii]|uniref:hypothetical protein n=1 Tax=Enterobacter roggenkampii TaxID=1812935 RepID=UPI001F412CB0|nr:hypothetical protein [Enterobacter roggenkampii]MCE5966897.1 hypothetical protein [Enterobacter roggenkampii]MCE5971329.1 hypothetical protein [Enterobacter roggenkampii]UHY21679.1 hypothetical protein LL005_16860 [Enterobacter roggenkampii]
MSKALKPSFSLRNIKYHREGEYAIDNVHLLMPLGVGEYEYAIPTDSSDTVLKLTNFLFSSLNEDDEFDNDKFQRLLSGLPTHELTMKSMIKDEFLAVDFLVFCAFQAHRFIDKNIYVSHEDNYGACLSLLFLQRVLGSLQSVAILIKNSMYFDINCLLRSILEQIGHAYQILHVKEPKDAEKFISTKGITALKQIIPEAGELYGLLSDYVHNGKRIWSNFLEVEEGLDGGESQVFVLSRSGKQTKYCIIYFTRIVQAYLSVLIHIKDEHLSEEIDDTPFVRVITECCEQIHKVKEDMSETYFPEI